MKMVSSISLIDMPEVVMRKILNECDFVSIQILQKICHELRNFIEENPVNSKISEVKIRVESKTINFQLTLPDETLNLQYELHKDGARMTRFKKDWEKVKILENSDFLDVFLKDFALNTRDQREILEIFNLEFRYYTGYDEDMELDNFSLKLLEKLNLVLEFRKYELRVQKLEMMASNQDQVLPILECLDSKSIENIKILDAKCGYNRKFEIDKIIKLDQWKNAKKLQITNFSVYAPIQSFLHFTKVVIYMETITTEDFLLLFENVKNHSNFEKFELWLTHHEVEDYFIENHGQPELDAQYGHKIWYFKMENWILKIFLKPRSIILEARLLN